MSIDYLYKSILTANLVAEQAVPSTTQDVDKCDPNHTTVKELLRPTTATISDEANVEVGNDTPMNNNTVLDTVNTGMAA